MLAGQKTGRATNNITSGFALVFILHVFWEEATCGLILIPGR